MHCKLRTAALVRRYTYVANAGYQAALAEEIKTLDTMLERLALQHASRLPQRFGAEPQTAAVLVAVAGVNPKRLKSEAALAAL
ncbi:transposase [Mycetohabitans rhizoxinica HKI 454]|jgi:hypothetical protein|uniref:Transposase n=2 Tax=Mycetohabitans rhizoxinica TaxID=412963 RepID=E5ATJ1_MYCRK|nr:transposase [Mycetohabitans rhizoxinica HKI 454]CBW75865.1 transposase [Mycetohabitans rhizoxinica HKI 454]